MNRFNITAIAAAITLAFSAGALAADTMSKAELEARNNPNDRTRLAVGTAKADADYAVAKEKCDDRKGADKTACVKEAKAVEARPKADAKPTQASAAPAPKTESPGEYMDDALITTKVKAAVLGEPSLKSAEINVETLKGTVQLTGFVSSRADVDKAVQVARAVKGVKSVKNDMILKGRQG